MITTAASLTINVMVSSTTQPIPWANGPSTGKLVSAFLSIKN